MGNLDISYKVFGIFKVNPFQFEFMTALEPKRSDGSSNFTEFHNLSRQINGDDINVLLMVYNDLDIHEETTVCFKHHVIVNHNQINCYESRHFFSDSDELLVIVFHDKNFDLSEINRIDSELEAHYKNALINTEIPNPMVPQRLGLSLIKR
jgi:hypothetical protein